MAFELTILGCNAAVPAFGRHPSAQVLKVQEQLYLIDCGEGTQMRMLENKIKRSKIKAIFISHLHGDHIFGLIGLLNSFNLSKRSDQLDVFGPIGLEEIINVQLKYSGHALNYKLNIHVIDTLTSETIYEDHLIKVINFPLIHRVPTTGYLFLEKEKLPNIKGELVKQYKIPYDQINGIKNGNDFRTDDGLLIPYQQLIIPAKQGRSFAYCSDTMYTEQNLDLIKGANLLYHESTFAHQLLPLAVQTMHSTALQAARLASKAKVGKLILGHYSSRYKDVEVLLEEAKQVFFNTVLGEEGTTYKVAN